MAVVLFAENTRIDYMLTTTTRQMKSAPYYAVNAILELDISTIILLYCAVPHRISWIRLFSGNQNALKPNRFASVLQAFYSIKTGFAKPRRSFCKTLLSFCERLVVLRVLVRSVVEENRTFLYKTFLSF